MGHKLAKFGNVGARRTKQQIEIKIGGMQTGKCWKTRKRTGKSYGMSLAFNRRK